MKRKTLVTLFTGNIIMFSLIACTIKTQSESEEYSDIKTEQLKTNILNDTFTFGAANKILVYDSILIVYDELQPEKLQFFNKETGEHLGSFGRTGQGDKELIQPHNISINTDTGIISIYDYTRGILLACRLEDLGNMNQNDWFAIPLPEFDVKPKEIIPIDNNEFFAFAGSPRFSIALNGEIINSYDEYSDKVDKNNARMFYLMETLLGVSPKGNKIVQASNIGEILETFIVDEKEIKSLSSQCFNAPNYQVEKGQISPKEDTIYGFSCLSVTDNNIFATLFGVPNPTQYPNTIIEYDWNGTKQKELATDQQIVCFTFDEQTGKFYSIIMGKDNEQILVSFDS